MQSGGCTTRAGGIWHGWLRCKVGGIAIAEPMTSRNTQKLVAWIGREAGLEEPLHPHSLLYTRHGTVATGYDILEVQELVGQASVATTMIYRHVDPARLSRRVQQLSVI